CLNRRPGAPSIAHFAMGGCKVPAVHDAVVFAFSSQPQKTVISTEAAHGLIVSSAAEKSASLPKQHLRHCRVPHPSRTLRLVGCKVPAIHDAVVFAFSSQPQKTVISTEAAHGLIVSSAAEKSASLPKQHLSHCRVFAVALVI